MKVPYLVLFALFAVPSFAAEPTTSQYKDFRRKLDGLQNDVVAKSATLAEAQARLAQLREEYADLPTAIEEKAKRVEAALGGPVAEASALINELKAQISDRIDVRCLIGTPRRPAPAPTPKGPPPRPTHY